MSPSAAAFPMAGRPARHRGLSLVEVSAALAVAALVSVGAMALGSRVFRAWDVHGEVAMVGDIADMAHHLFAGAPDYTGIGNYDIRTVPGMSKHIRVLPGIGLAIASIGGRQVSVTSNPGGHEFFVSIPATATDECMALSKVDEPIWLAGTSLAGSAGFVSWSGPGSVATASPICAGASAGWPVTVRFTYR